MYINTEVDIPEPLITAQRDGELVVFAGAGISTAAPQEPAPPAPAEPPPAEPAPQQPAPTEPPAPSGPPAGVPGVCTCSGPDLNCKDFGTHAQAQACHDYCVRLGYGDRYKLDGNNDGDACESLP